MQKFLQLTCFISMFFVGTLRENLYAQITENISNTEDTLSSPEKGILVKGIVRDAKTGIGISGINLASATFATAITKDDGTFSINVPHLDALLSINGQEYQSKVHPLKKQTNNIEIFLFEKNYSQFYQKPDLQVAEKFQFENSKATTVTAFEDTQWGNPVQESVSNFLQGKIAGLNIVRKSGVPGSGSYLTLRGINSIYGSNKPLIIVDGMIYDDEDYGSGIIQNYSSSPLSDIDVKDIEDVTVIKDGSALYGTKGGNGVIIITTTRPNQLSTKIDFTMYGGVNQSPDELPILEASDYRTYLSQIFSTQENGRELLENQVWMIDDTENENYHRYHNNTNWQNKIYRTGVNQNYYLKIRGGDDIAKYGLSVGYLKSDGVMAKNDLERYNMRLNASLRLTEALSMDARFSFVRNIQNQFDQGLAYKTNPLYLALTKAPFTTTNAVNEEGEVSPNLADVDTLGVGNPISILENGIGRNENYRFFGNLHFKYTFNENFAANTILGLTYDKERENFFIPGQGIADITLPTAIADNRSGSEVQRLYTLFTDTYLDYNNIFNHRNSIDIRLGFRTQSNESESDLGLGYNSATDDFTSVGAGSNLLRYVGGHLGEWNWLNAYFTTKYNYLYKYYLTLNASLDGSSRFGNEIQKSSITIGENSLSTLASISGAWILSSEPFFKNAKALNLLKLRATLSFSGNDDIGNFTAQKYYISQNLLGLQGLVRGNIGNPELKWETVRKLNFGTDISIFKERLNISFDIYKNQTKDMITYESLNNATGFEYMVTNSGEMKTTGAELSLNARIINNSELNFDLGVNIGKYENEMTALPGDPILTNFGQATYITAVGYEANLFYGYKTNGVYSSTSEAENEGLSKRMSNGELIPYSGGDMRFVDVNGDLIIDENDRTIIGNPNPEFSGSISTNISWKKFDLQGLFTFSVGNDIYNSLRHNLEKMDGYENQTVAINNRWRTEGHKTNIPKATWGDPLGNSSFSNRWIEDGSYLRLKTLVIGYNFNINNEGYIKYVRLYATGNNLLTFTDYLGYDPEFSATNSIFGQGVDIGLTPQFRSVQLGLRLGL
ncbi:SusC/RagA family TonB-linked outer membrane protein [Zunongwangia sp. SCSIO 43204]|uniref:SusC/RagA family TonB-linked outer membrane protein n=1 Tax=Zunongwangia sp. SCSIO 43204 TaxID=2779359 RepID=UPI001CA8D809|nr:SusC/RagA family TonB-linked outer membrane protein [Zunongwangia sp. SCSIO 43204]UAB82644.1 SusC/RagA family TonB-linked outer membrane protein [Zunongwangia sp. SCSIO 43204]